MSKRCPITSKGVMYGNKVSHANNKSRRRFLPNLQHASFMSEALGRSVQLRLSTRAIRTIEFHGGLDALLIQAKTAQLDPEIVRLKKVILKNAATKSA